MYRRMYGTRHHAAARHLIPIMHEPWLQAKSPVPAVLWILCIAVDMLLITVLLESFGRSGMVPNAVGVMLLLRAALALPAACISLIILVFAWLRPAVYQYCPECFSYITRGAKVCSFCHFRPQTPLSATPPRRPAHQQTRS
jgi:hypothetical protein